jgi:hypothetical protein
MKKKDSSFYDEKRQFSYSKLQVVITASIFIICVLFVMYLYLSNDIHTVADTAAIVSLVTVSGAIFGSNLCWYSKKAASENQYKLRMNLYNDSTKIRLEYNEAMMKLIKEYKLTPEDIEYINDTGDIDNMMDGALDDVVNNLDSSRDDADSPNEIQSFNMQ